MARVMYPGEVTSMSIWIVGMLCEEDLLLSVERNFPTPEDGDYVSELLRQPDFNEMLRRSANSIRRFAENRLKNCMTGEEFIRKMKAFVEANTIIPGYVPR